MKNRRSGMAAEEIRTHSPDIKNGRGGNPGRLTGKIELRGGIGGGCRREKSDVRLGKGDGRAGREKNKGRDGIIGAGEAGMQNTCGLGGNKGDWADCTEGGERMG